MCSSSYRRNLRRVSQPPLDPRLPVYRSGMRQKRAEEEISRRDKISKAKSFDRHQRPKQAQQKQIKNIRQDLLIVEQRPEKVTKKISKPLSYALRSAKEEATFSQKDREVSVSSPDKKIIMEQDLKIELEKEGPPLNESVEKPEPMVLRIRPVNDLNG